MLDNQLASISVDQLKGVGPALREKLAKLNINNVQDLLFHFPLRYQDRSRLTPIGACFLGQEVLVEGEIRQVDVSFGKRRSLMVRLQDDTGVINLRFFHFSGAQKTLLENNQRLRAFGEIRRGLHGYEMVHPEYDVDQPSKPLGPVKPTLTPIYPSTDGLHQASWRKLCQQALICLARTQVTDLLPDSAPQAQISLTDAVRYLHEAPFNADVQALREGTHPAQQRLALEELTAHQVSMLLRKAQFKHQPGVAIPDNGGLVNELLKRLPFSLTQAQQRVMHDIELDLASGQPMHRLIQGDVGSGKTIVAALSALYAIANGFQVAIMAPTEILAEQHLEAFSEWLEPLGIHIGWLTGSSRVKHRREVLEGLANNSIQLLIGTHALFQESVDFAKLGLVVIDEQHRFGVHQRLALREKGKDIQPHQLIMTATPIPRTLAMSSYADLDISVIDELPAGRIPINTVLIDNARRDQVIARVAGACDAGKQAYWVCTLIEESEALQCQAAEDCANQLQMLLPNTRIGLVHGRMKADEKSIVMDAFKRAEIDLLVATTVIEVGVNVPNASLMIIENPERLGLAQLHQLRGRVGRGSEASHCVLMYQDPLSLNGKQRLKIMRETTNGFIIAEEDLKLRGPGEFMGTRQTGVAQMKVADLGRDAHLFDDARQLAELLIKKAPDKAEALVQRWLAGADRYADA